MYLVTFSIGRNLNKWNSESKISSEREELLLTTTETKMEIDIIMDRKSKKIAAAAAAAEDLPEIWEEDVKRVEQSSSIQKCRLLKRVRW